MSPRVKLISRFRPQTGSGRSKLFGPPPLLPGEDKAAYESLLAQASRVIGPTDLIEEIWLNDFVHETWELRQVRQALQGLLSIALTRALQGRLLTSSNLREGRVDTLMKLWLAGDAAAIAQIEKILSEANLTFETVRAQAFRDTLDDGERLYRLMAIIEARRNAVLREIERRRASFAQKLRENSDYLDAIGPATSVQQVAGPNDASN